MDAKKKTVVIARDTYDALNAYLRETGLKQYAVASIAIEQYLENQKTTAGKRVVKKCG